MRTTTQGPPVAFLFPSPGIRPLLVSRELYDQEPVFRDRIDLCAVLLAPLLGRDLRELLFPEGAHREEARRLLAEVPFSHAGLIAIEDALVTWWMERGLQPAAVAGHSVGEYAAACAAGVLSLPDALRLVVARGRLIRALPEGMMLAVALSAHEIRPLLTESLDLAADNGPSRCVVSGPGTALDELRHDLAAKGVACDLLGVRRPFHSRALEPAALPFLREVERIPMHPPRIPWLSSATGGWIAVGSSLAPSFWVDHMLGPVRFSAAATELLHDSRHIGLEVGPGRMLCQFIALHPGGQGRCLVPSLPRKAGRAELLAAVDRLTAAGVQSGGCAAPLSSRESAAPWSPLERIVAAAWRESLGGGALRLDQDFYDSGGDSLAATRLVTALWRDCAVELSLGEILEAPNVVGLAGLVAARQGEVADRIEPTESTAETLLTSGQEQMWHLDQVTGHTAAYHVFSVLRLRGRLDRAALERAVQAVVARHDALLTVFDDAGGRPTGRLAPLSPVVLPVADLAGLPAEQRGAESLRTAAALVRRLFDLRRGPLFRLCLSRLDDGEHLLTLSMHHAVSDGWSKALFFQELFVFYRQVVERTVSSPPPPLPIRYGDFARWQHGRVAAERRAASLSHWREALRDLTVLELPTDRSRPARREFRGARRRVVLSAALAGALRGLGHDAGATLFMTLLSAFQALLHRYTGQDGFVVGSPIAGRGRPEVAGLIGYFATLLPFQARLSGSPGFRQLLGRVREAALEAYGHPDVDFEELAAAVQPQCDPSRNPIFQAAFILQVSPLTGCAPLNGLEVEVAEDEVDPGAAKFDLTLQLTEEPGALRGFVEIDAALFDPATGLRLARHFETLLWGAVAAPDRLFSELPLLTPPEGHQLRFEWNDTDSAFPRESTIPELFLEQVVQRPDAVALVAETLSLTYRALARRSDGLAALLRREGVGPEVVVGISARRSPAMVVGLLAILKAGGAYLPLDPDHPGEWLRFQVHGVRAPVVLADGSLREALPGDLEARIVDLDEGEADAVGSQGLPPLPESVACVMYTSGSTGTPKAVAVNHRGVVRLVRGTGYARLAPDEVFLQLAPLSFDASTFEIWGSLLNGARLVLAPPELSSLEELGSLLEDCGITTLWLSAGLFHQMVDAAPDRLRGLRQLFAGGAVLSPSHVRALVRRPGFGVVVDGYGPTEGTTFTCCHRCTEEDPEPVPIGRPIANTRVILLDTGGQPVPVGVPGELYLGGDGLARGYLGRSDLTAERFLPDPHGPAGSRLYRTGDLARHLPGGRIQFFGRMDRQVKIRGFRVEPAEIETALVAHPAVAQAVVVAIPAPGVPGDQRLAAYLVARGDAPPAAALRLFLGERLPAYAIPNWFVLLPALPLNANGKVDVARLPEPQPAGRGPAESPRTSTEEAVARVWREVLGLSEIGINDSFLDLGGSSLAGLRLASRLRAELHVPITLPMILRHPTVAGLAALLGEAALPDGDRAGPDAVPLRAAGEPVPLSAAQEGLWFLSQLDPTSPAYHVVRAHHLSGPLDSGLLAASLLHLQQRHELLRTSFPALDGRPVQRVAAEASLRLPIVDLTGLPVSCRAEVARGLAAEEGARLFHLAEECGLRALLLRLGTREHVLVLTLHHLVADEWSLPILVAEVSAVYAALLAFQAPALPELPIQYADWTLWQRRRLSAALVERQLAFWRPLLAGCSPLLDLPAENRAAAHPQAGDVRPLYLPPALAPALFELAHRRGATLFAVLLAAFDTLLCRWTGRTDLAVGTPFAGRDYPETQSLIGCFVNTLVLRSELSARQTFLELLDATRNLVLAALVNADLPFDRLVRELRPARLLGETPLFNVMFAFQESAEPPLCLPGAASTLWPIAGRTAKFDLTVTLGDGQGGLSGRVEFRRGLLDPVTVDRMSGHFAALLGGIAADPSRRLGELSFLQDGERHQALHEWSRSAPADRVSGGLHTLFEEQAARAPDALAVVAPHVRWTYGALNQRADRLAARLRRLGVGPEILAGICLRRSPELLMACLAVLKAGGAWVPLDPEDPPERLKFLLQDSRALLVLCDAETAARLPAPAVVRRTFLDDDGGPAAREDGGLRTPAPAGAAAAYIIYTSGSTGVPKGVIVPHDAVVTYVRAVARTFGLTDGDRVLQFAAFSFDASVGEIFSAFASGATLVLRGDAWLDSAEAFLRACADWRITFMDLPTAFWHELTTLEGVPLPPTLRLLFIGGERALPSRLALWHARVRGAVRIVNGYGPTEATVAAAFSDLTYWRPALGLDVPIGRALSGSELYVLDVLDGGRELVAAGTPGELCIGGRGVARGYLHRPGLTAERFVPHPFAIEPGERLYRTGDRVRFRPDGELEYLGRIDHQVKVRGFRVEPGEIEAALSAHPAVREAAVVAREEPGGEVRLTACVAAAAGKAPSAADLRAILAERLPKHMVPVGWIFLPTLPRTPSGKIDRNALAGLRPDSALVSRDATPPRNRPERILSAIWARILGLGAVGVHDDFFALGGDSLLSIQVVAAARQEGLAVTPRQIFLHRTIAGLAALAPSRHAARAEVAVAGDVPLTPVQHWFFDFDLGDRNHWNTASLLAPTIPLNSTLAARAAGHLVRHHDALRSRFSRTPDGWRQEIAAPNGALPWSEIDLSSLPAAQQSPALETILAQVQTSLSLCHGPVLRICLFHLDSGADAGQRLLLLAHHLVSDGVSLQILVEDIDTAYRQLAGGETVRLPVKTTSVKEWAERLRGYADSSAMRREAAYWLEQPWPEAHRTPVDFAAGENSRASGRILARELDPGATDRLLRFAAARRFEVADLLLASLAAAVANWARHTPLLIGVVRHGREEIFPDVDLTRTVAWFNSIFPVLLDVPSGAAPAEFADQVAHHMRRLPAGGIGYGLLRFVSSPTALSARVRLIPRHEISLNYLGRLLPPQGLFRPACEPCGPHHSPHGVRQSLIMLSAGIEDGRLRLSWSFSRNKHRSETIANVAATQESWLLDLVNS